MCCRVDYGRHKDWTIRRENWTIRARARQREETKSKDQEGGWKAGKVCFYWATCGRIDAVKKLQRRRNEIKCQSYVWYIKCHHTDLSSSVHPLFCRCLWWVSPWPLASPALSAQHFTIKPLKTMVTTKLLSLNILPLHIHKIIYFFKASNISHPGGSRLLADQSFKVTMLFMVEYLLS